MPILSILRNLIWPVATRLKSRTTAAASPIRPAEREVIPAHKKDEHRPGVNLATAELLDGARAERLSPAQANPTPRLEPSCEA